MSAERLSKLQKWILKILFIYSPDTPLITPEIKRCAFWGVRGIEERPLAGILNKDSRHVILSRSFKNLEDKELVERLCPSPAGMMVALFESVGEKEKATPYKNLIKEKGQSVQVPMPVLRRDMADAIAGGRGYTHTKAIYLTDKGRTKAKELLNVKKGNLTIRAEDR